MFDIAFFMCPKHEKIQNTFQKAVAISKMKTKQNGWHNREQFDLTFRNARLQARACNQDNIA